MPVRRALLCLIGLLLALPALAEPPLRFGTFSNLHSPGLGACEAVLREAYAQLGREIRIEHLPAQRSLYWADNGRLDGDLCRAKRHGQLLQVATPVYHWQLVAFSTRPLRTGSWADLQGLRISYERGMAVIAEHRELDLFPANSIESAIQMLAQGRVDVLLDDYNSVLYSAKTLQVDNLVANQPPLMEGPIYHLLNREHQHLATQLDQVLAGMQRSGRIQQIANDVLQQYLRAAAAGGAKPSR